MPANDFIANQAETLGITLSDKNFVKLLWEQYCSDITSLSHPPGDAVEESGPESLEVEEKWQDRLSIDDKIISILNVIRDDQDLRHATADQEQLDWIEQQITILNRLKGDIELSLRYTSIADDGSSIIAR